MTVSLSSGLRNTLLGTGTAAGFAGVFTNGVIYLFSGPQPVNADQGTQGTLLGIVTKSGSAFNAGTAANGLNFAAPASGTVTKDNNTWQMTGLAAGTAGWFRLMGNAVDSFGSSTTLPRMDGSIAAGGGGDMNLANTIISSGAPTTVDVFQFTMPAQ
jgi:hypothetical protein